MERVQLEIGDFAWHESTLRHIRRHGGSVRLCRDVLYGSPMYFTQVGKKGSHLMIGPSANGRLWTIVIDYLGNQLAKPISAWPSKRQEIRRYESEMQT